MSTSEIAKNADLITANEVATLAAELEVDLRKIQKQYEQRLERFQQDLETVKNNYLERRGTEETSRLTEAFAKFLSSSQNK